MRSCANSEADSTPRPRRHSISGTSRLAQIGERLAHSRAELVDALSPYAAEAFSILATQAGSFKMRYVRSWEGTLSEALASARREDLRRATTTVGPQRDDVEIEAGGLDARTRLSQGRQDASPLRCGFRVIAS